MKKTKKVILVFPVLLFLLSLQLSGADIVSINSGGSKTTAITPSKNIEGFFLGGQKKEEPSGGGSGGGGGGSSYDDDDNETENFELSRNSISISLKPNKTKRECFETTNLKEEAIFEMNATMSGSIKEYAELSIQEFNLMEGMSERNCVTFSSQGLKEGSFSGKVTVSKNQSKSINLDMNIIEEKPESDGDVDSEPRNLSDGIKDIEESIPDIRGIESLILWLPLLLAILIFLIIKKYSQFMKSVSGKKTREERVAQVERMKRANQRSEKNFLENIVNKAAISLTKKTIGEKEEKTKNFNS